MKTALSLTSLPPSQHQMCYVNVPITLNLLTLASKAQVALHAMRTLCLAPTPQSADRMTLES